MSDLSPPTDDARREAAAAWLVRLESPDATEADWAAFETWLGDAANKSALNAIEVALAVVEDHPEAFATAEASRSAQVIPLPWRTGARRAIVFGFATAAAAAVTFVVIKVATPPVQQMAYAAPSDSALTVTLPDASRMTLNRGTSARVRWSTRERRIELEQGEAAFQVTHNDATPFVVAAGTTTIRDLGTEFNVLSERNALTVSVRSGSVAIRAPVGTATLARGDQARVSDGRVALSQVNPDDALAWREGRLTYHNAPLSQVIADLNRYSPTPISVADDRAGSLRFSGVLVIDSPSSMTTRLEAFLPVRTEQNARGIVVRSR